MSAWFRFKDWPLRAKMAALLVVASLVPLAIALWTSINNAHQEQLQRTEAVLTARAEELVAGIDAFNDGYLHAASRVARIPSALTLLQTTPGQARQIQDTLNSQLQVWPATDSSIRGIAILDSTGTVIAGTEPELLGMNLAYRSFVKMALQGSTLVSDVFLAGPEVGDVPTAAFLAPMQATDGSVIGVATIWVQAAVLADVVRASNGKGGNGSFSVLMDSRYIRMAHSSRNDLEFRPTLPLSPGTIDELVAEQRFGQRTREFLQDVEPVNWNLDVPAEALPDAGMFIAHALDGTLTGYVIGRRCASASWTVYFAMPISFLQAEMTRIARQKLLFAVAIMLVALLVGALFAAVILQPLGQLAAGARAIGAGDLAARVAITRQDELGQLGETFNAMATRIQEQAAELKRESEDQYRKLFQTMAEGFCTIQMIFDGENRPIDFIYLEANQEFEAQSGLRDVKGKRKTEVAPELEEHWMQIYGQVALTGEPVQIEEEAKDLGRHFDVRAYRIGGPESRRVAVLFNDISERRQAQLRQQAELQSLNLLHQITRAIGERQDLHSIFQIVLRTLEDRLPVDFGCICFYEAESNRLLVACIGERSQSLAQEIGLQEQTSIEIDPDGLSRCVQGHLVHEPDVRSVRFPFTQGLAGIGMHAMVAAPLLVESKVFGVLITARGKGDFSSGECQFLRQLSEHVALAAHQSQLYTALHEAYENLRQSQQAALQQERLRALGQMASGIAHDINNAMSPVSLYTDSLLEHETQLSDKGRGELQTIQRAIGDVAATVARIREFYRDREPQLSLTPVKLNQLVQQVVELTRPRWSTLPLQRGINIELHTALQPDLPAIMGAENEIREALTNLVFNAVDAMPEGGQLTIGTCITDAGLVQLEVRDTGVGMDEDSRRRCLEPFFTTKGERGTGLGLAMVYGMAQRHSANIDIVSAPGQGTSMRIEFRASAEGSVVADVKPAVVPQGLTILLVDDDPVMLRSLRDIFEHDGHTVFAANGGQEGLALARSTLARGQQFSVAITDLGMTQVDGREVASVLKSLAPQLPVILLTGWGERLISEGDIPPGVDLVLSKPPKLRDLREALARCCGPNASGTG